MVGFLVEIIDLLKRLEEVRKWVVKEGRIVMVKNYLVVDIVDGLIGGYD